uniref:Receptor-interacting serine/threonine-protein kinase 1-like n=1 Tax=Phallusia mammillata TaxID=59560 RepID=A0A6F9DQ76_9ASCI|nr:receptor-interacting serine/threonine-protein kinase 1-like [Phallusia mammillata]
MEMEVDVSGVSQRAKFYKASNLVTSRFRDKFFIGNGRNGAVRKCLIKESNQVVAAKCFNICSGGDEFDSKLNGFLTEINSLVRIEHENVVQVIGWTKWKTNVAIILEYVEGNNLKCCLHNNSIEMSWENRTKVVYQLVLALKYLHNYQPGRGLRHGDIKPENIIVTHDLVLKLADFGAANIIRATGLSTSTSEVPSSRQCTILYAAPETTNITVLADMYSFAIVVYEVITKILPFSEYEVSDGLLFAMKNNGTKPQKGLKEIRQQMVSEVMQSMFDTLYHIMKSCWDVDPNKRWSANDVVDYLEKNSIEIIELNAEQDSDEACKPTTKNKLRNMVELSSFTAPFEECPISINQVFPSVEEPEHCFGFSALIPESNKFRCGNRILYSLDGSFEKGLLWHTTVYPTTNTNITGFTEKVDLEGNRVASDWFEADRAIFRTFTGVSDIQPLSIPSEKLIFGSPKSVIFALRNDNLLLHDYTCLECEAESLHIKTGVLKRALNYSYISGLAVDKTARTSLLQFASVLADKFGKSNVCYVSFSRNDKQWKTYMMNP